MNGDLVESIFDLIAARCILNRDITFLDPLMANHKNLDPITASEIKAYASTRDDFGLELYAQRIALQNGFKASHGGTYEDSVTHKPRQYDVRASIERTQRRIDLAIECKSIQTVCPLIISRVARVSAESFHEVVHSFKRALGMHYMPTNVFVPAKSVRLRSAHSMYREGEFVGKAMAQLQRTNGGIDSNDSGVYDKWSQALASAEELIFDSIYRYAELNENDGLTAVLPVLVVSDQSLWVMDYSCEGAMVDEPKRVDEATLYLGREYSRKASLRFTMSHLHIVTKVGLEALLKSIHSDNTVWESLFPDQEIDDFEPYQVEPTVGIRLSREVWPPQA